MGIDKWAIVSAVFEDYRVCPECEWLDKYGDCKLLTRDNMFAEFCTGWDDKVEELDKDE